MVKIEVNENKNEAVIVGNTAKVFSELSMALHTLISKDAEFIIPLVAVLWEAFDKDTETLISAVKSMVEVMEEATNEIKGDA